MAWLRVVLTIMLLTPAWPAQPAEAVGLGFANGIGGAGFDQGAAVALDGSGNVYVTGQFRGTVDFDPGPGTVQLTSTTDPALNQQLSDVFVAKYAPTGALGWVRAFSGTGSDEGRAIAVDGGGNVYVTGGFSGDAYFRVGSSSGTLVATSASNQSDVFVLKLNTNGGFIWARAVGGPAVDLGRGIVVGTGGDVYVTGSFQGTADFDRTTTRDNDTEISAGGDNGFALKLDSNGGFVWVWGFGGTSSYGNGITLAVSGAYVTGSFRGELFPGGRSPLTNPGPAFAAYVAHFGPSGTLLWKKGLGGGANTAHGRGIAADSTGFRIAVAGEFGGTVDFDPGTGSTVLTSTGTLSDAFVLELDALNSGAFTRVRTFSTTSFANGNAVDFDRNGNVYVAGRFAGTADFDPGPGSFPLASAGDADLYVLKLDRSGNFVWARGIGGPSGDEARGLATDGAGSVYLTGSFQDTVDFDPGPGTRSLAATGFDGFLARLVEDAPTNVLPGPQTALRDTPRVFSGANGNRISVLAPDTGSDLRVTLIATTDTSTNGTLTLAGTAGLTFQGGDGTADPLMTFTGTVAAVNAALDGLRYAPPAGFTGQATIEIRSGVASDDNPSGAIRTDVDMLPIAVHAAQCTPRPRVQVQPAPGGGRLQVTVLPTPLNGGGTNAVRELRFGALDGARVTLDGQPVAPNQVVTFTPGRAQAGFTVERATAGRAMTAHLTVVDGCGDWSTFVGAGTGAAGT